MDAFLAMTVEDRRAACGEVQARQGLPAVSVEKDLWVCWILRELFGLPGWGEHFTFKGGTSLSKAWKLIDRFSEDIDIVIDRDFLGFGGEKSPEAAPSKSKRKVGLTALKAECQRRIHAELAPALEAVIRQALPAEPAWRLVPAPHEEDPDGQTLLFHYPSVFSERLGYVRPVVKIEMGARSDTEPAESPVIHPYLSEALPEIFGPGKVQVRVLAPERTFWEKAMLLHEEACRPVGKARKARLARHYYDLWCLITKGIAAKAVASPGLFERVATHREIFFNWFWMDYSTLRPGRLRIVPPVDQIQAWRQDYESMRREMFFGDVPGFDEIMDVVGRFERQFNGHV